MNISFGKGKGGVIVFSIVFNRGVIHHSCRENDTSLFIASLKHNEKYYT